jgi:phosphoribosylaminoimidazole-succinocarboxamide synthase
MDTLLYAGKAKEIHAVTDHNKVLVRYTDNMTAFNAQQKAVIEHKGALNNEITTILFEYLARHGVMTHFIQKTTLYEQLCHKVQIISLEVIVRNIATGSMVKKLGMIEGTIFTQPLVEFSYKNDSLGDPLVNEQHILELNLANKQEIVFITQQALLINAILQPLFLHCKLKLVDFKLEFGKKHNGEIVLADEISPDTCRLWDLDTNNKLDKDRFRLHLGNIADAYMEVLSRLKNYLSLH